jgi:hypothetical protein
VDHPLDRNVILEIRLLSFSTGQPHRLVEQPNIFVATKSLLLDCTCVGIEIVGDFIVFLITFQEGQEENNDMFFLVRWKRGEAYCVSISLLQHNPNPPPGPPLILIFSFGPPPEEPIHVLPSSPKTPS